MTRGYVWVQNHASKIWWLRKSFAPTSVGLMHRNSPSESRNPDVYECPDVYEWRVAKWVPTETFIAYLPADMPEAEALETAKMLILLSLKESQS